MATIKKIYKGGVEYEMPQGPTGPTGPQGATSVYDQTTQDFLTTLETTTGQSQTKTMTQKAVTDELSKATMSADALGAEEISSFGSEINGWISSETGGIVTTAGSKHYVLEVSNDMRLTIIPGANVAVFVFASAIADNNSWTPIGSRYVWDIGSSIVVPDAAKYLIVGKKSSSLSDDFTPKIFKSKRLTVEKKSYALPPVLSRPSLIADNQAKCFRWESDAAVSRLTVKTQYGEKYITINSPTIPYNYTGVGTLALVAKTDLSGVEIVGYNDADDRIILAIFLYDALRYRNGGLVTKIIASALPVSIKTPSFVELSLSEVDGAALTNGITANAEWKVFWFPCHINTTYRITAEWNEDNRRWFTCFFTEEEPAIGVSHVEGKTTALYNANWTGNGNQIVIKSDIDGYICFHAHKTYDYSVKAEEVNIDIKTDDIARGQYTKLTFANWNFAHYNLGSGIEHRIDTDEEYNKYLPIYRKVYSQIDADIISLCEYEIFFKKNATDKTTRRLLLPQYPYYKDCKTVYSGQGSNYNDYKSNGLALYSKLPLRNITEHPFNNYISGKPKYYYDADICIDGHDVKVVGTHLTHDVDHIYAPLQMQELIAAYADYKHVIIMADWNSAPADFQPLKDAGYSLANNDYYGSIRTFWDREQWYEGCMDNIAVKGGVISNVRVIQSNHITGVEDILSDHLPIACDVVFYD